MLSRRCRGSFHGLRSSGVGLFCVSSVPLPIFSLCPGFTSSFFLADFRGHSKEPFFIPRRKKRKEVRKIFLLYSLKLCGSTYPHGGIPLGSTYTPPGCRCSRPAGALCLPCGRSHTLQVLRCTRLLVRA